MCVFVYVFAGMNLLPWMSMQELGGWGKEGQIDLICKQFWLI